MDDGERLRREQDVVQTNQHNQLCSRNGCRCRLSTMFPFPVRDQRKETSKFHAESVLETDYMAKQKFIVKLSHLLSVSRFTLHTAAKSEITQLGKPLISHLSLKRITNSALSLSPTSTSGSNKPDHPYNRSAFSIQHHECRFAQPKLVHIGFVRDFLFGP
jgi:hypothetical protein